MKSTSGKLLASAALVASAAAVAGLGTYGAFTDTTQADVKVDAGDVVIELNKAGANSNLDLAATKILPGDTIQRLATLTNDASSLASVSLTTTATESSALTTNPKHGLQLTIDRCSAAWTGAPETGYTCAAPATQSQVVERSAIIAADRKLSGLGVEQTGGVDYLLVTAAFPAEAEDKLFRNAAATVNFTFTAMQRSGTNK
ncbi:MAG: hypothetical protein JWO49_2549 [Arthrobacter sp.]|nr:hypothetical protein [Arthrobacter sp.]